MESKISKPVRDLKMEQTLYIDLETTDLIDYKALTMPWIIELAIHFGDGKRFRTMITPPVKDFEIHPKATEVHGWTKEKLLDLPVEERPTLDRAWLEFIRNSKTSREFDIVKNT